MEPGLAIPVPRRLRNLRINSIYAHTCTKWAEKLEDLEVRDSDVSLLTAFDFLALSATFQFFVFGVLLCPVDYPTFKKTRFFVFSRR
jgi:hypothetical protein